MIPTTSRVRALSLVLAFAAPILSGCAFETPDGGSVAGEPASVGAVSQALASDIAVYANTAPASPWQSWSWWSTVALANSDAPMASGSTSQIKVSVQSSGGALSLAHATADLAVADYDSITFAVRAPTSGTVTFFVQPLAGTSSGATVSVPVTTTWTTQTLKLDGVKGALTQFGKINWSGAAGQSFYVDNVKVIAKKTLVASSSFPTWPITVSKNNVVALSSSAGPYYLYVPTAYDATHNTPSKVLVWMHGCGGNGNGDAWELSPGGTQSWLTVSVGGRDGGCWDPNVDVPLVLAALDDVKLRLNVDPHRVVIGGYSSGGDLAYRTAFYNAKRFAGLIAENTSPFRDTGEAPAASLAAAAWKLNVAHLAHLSDPVYPIAGVRAETDAVQAAGFPMTRLERAGTHWDADTSSSGTNYDLRTYLLPYLDAGWVAPP